ncbi:hypothetical protein LCGC14_3079430 [marine sediment metagenome]|uniref:HTH merR-type domain-containing protein n=1 Tax=marine sediment metagenome TaxID=412755 RepID=A0A0F8WEK4_9ZZZZ
MKTLEAEAHGWYTTGEVAAALGMSKQRLRRRIQANLLQPPDKGYDHNQWYYSPEWLEKAKQVLHITV